MTNKISMIELFGGIGSQEKALRQFGIPYEITHYCDCDKDATLSYAAMRWDLEKEMKTFEFPSQDTMINELQVKNLGYDFQKNKHTITQRTPITKLKQYYIADKLSRNLGDISKVERLPYADIVTYSFPCTDLSVAGKGEGMVNKCDACGYSWPIDFSNVEETLICSKCGAEVSSSTRSGLLGQVQRLLSVAKEDDILPKYLLLENVKNLVGKKFIGQFEAWIKWLDGIGYNTYWKVLNGKHYGIPQNRERVFAISIRKDIDTKGFIFPESIPLTTRLKDILEQNVDEKYYLPDDRIEKILNSTFMQEKKRIQVTDVCDTLLARDWKDPKCVPVEDDANPIRIGNIYDEKFGTGYAGNVWDKDGVSPTLQTAQGGNRMPLVLDEIKVVGNYMPSNHDASRVVDIDGIAPTVKENHGTVTAIAEPQIIKVGQLESSFDQSGRVYDPEGIAPTIMSNSHGKTSGGYTSPKIIVEEPDPFIVASRGRNPENPSDRTTGAPTEQRLEPNFSGCTNTLTSVQKDNYVCEPQVLRAERTEYGKSIRKQYEAGEVDEKISNMREMKPRTDGISNTITTVLKDNYICEPKIIQNPHGFNKGQINEICPSMTSSYFQENNYVAEPIIYDDYNSRISADQNAINTLTCNCGASAERNGVKILEPIVCEERKDEGIRLFKDDCVGTLRTIDACGDKRVLEPELVGGIGEKNFGKQYRQGNRVYNSEAVAMALNAQPVGNAGGYSYLYAVADKVKWRIRKLTPKCCWRLMGFTDKDHDRAAKYTSASARYKQAGNSICTCCLISIFSSLFLENGHKAEVWSKYLINYDD